MSRGVTPSPPPPKPRRGQQRVEEGRHSRTRLHTKSGGQVAHSSLAEAERPLAWEVEAQDPDPTFPSSLAGRKAPTAQVAHDSMVGSQGQGLSPWGWSWVGPELSGMPRGPPHPSNQVHTPIQRSGQWPTGRSQQPPPADTRTSGQGMTPHGRRTGQVTLKLMRGQRRRMMLCHITCPLGKQSRFGGWTMWTLEPYIAAMSKDSTSALPPPPQPSSWQSRTCNSMSGYQSSWHSRENT